MSRLAGPAALLALVTLTPASGPAQAACGALLPPRLTTGPRRALEAADLVGLRDVGQPDASSFGQRTPFAVSPDGRSAAFVIMRADPSANRTCRGLALIDLATRAVRLLDSGGDDILARGALRGAVIAQGAPKTVTPIWSPDGRQIAYLRRDRGVTQAWVAGVSGTPARVATTGTSEITAVVWSPRSGLIVADDARAASYEAAVTAEGGSGWRYDERV